MILLFLIFLFVSSFSYAVEGSGLTNNVNFTVSQDYIISSDVLSKSGIVANQFDGLLSMDDLPDEYGDQLEDLMDWAWDYSQEWQFNQASNALPSIVGDQFDLIQALTNSHFSSDYGITATNIGMTSSNLMPSTNIVGDLVGVMKTIPNGSNTVSNVFSIHRFGSWLPTEDFWINLNYLPGLPYTFQVHSSAWSGTRFVTTCNRIYTAFNFLASLLTFVLVVNLCVKVVHIFSGGD